ncbi:MAG TPA: PEP-CTERM sorting domain-containing protein, partial [Planctomycetia bacterium]|nr:PEP-CTERM sorting domain-containing protein [Planctomycetia bacterium]
RIVVGAAGDAGPVENRAGTRRRTHGDGRALGERTAPRKPQRSGGANYDATTLGGSFATAAGQTLKGFGNVSGKTVIANGSTVAPGGSIGTLTFDNDLHLAGAFQVEVAATGTQLADLIQLTAGNATIGSGASLVFAATNTYDNMTEIPLLTVAGGGSLFGTFGSDFIFNLPSNYSLRYTGTSLFLTPVPEPGSIALVGLAAAAGWMIRRRKRAADAS